MKCLVVDGSATMRPILTRAVRMAGRFDVVEASSGHAALHLSDGSVDLVVADWTLPDIPFADFARRVRENHLHATPAVLVVTTEADVPCVKTAMIAGIDGYVVKPFAPHDFARALERVLAVRLA